MRKNVSPNDFELPYVKTILQRSYLNEMFSWFQTTLSDCRNWNWVWEASASISKPFRCCNIDPRVMTVMQC